MTSVDYRFWSKYLLIRGLMGIEMRGLKSYEFWIGIIGILSAFFSVYTYVVSKKAGRISYQIETQKIFDPHSLVNFRLIKTDGEQISQSVYASELVLWNSGDLSLGPGSDRMREPVKLSVEGDGAFHYFLISKTTNDPNTNFDVSISNDKKSAVLSWKFFDPGQGIRVTLVHSGISPEVNVKGKFFETEMQDEGDAVHKPDLNKQLRQFSFPTLAFVTGAMYLFLALWFFLQWRLSQVRENDGSGRFMQFLKEVSDVKPSKLVLASAFSFLGLFAIGAGIFWSVIVHSPPV